MNALLEAAVRLLDVKKRMSGRARRWRVRSSLWILAGSASTLALVFFAASLYLYAAQSVPPWQAAAVTGLAAFAVTGALLLGARWLHKRRVALARRHERVDSKRMTEAVLDELLQGGTLNASDLIVASLVAGIVLGASPKLRRELAAHRGRRCGGDHGDRGSEP